VQQHDLVGAVLGVALGQGHGIPLIPQVLELDPLHHPPIFHVQAGHNAGGGAPVLFRAASGRGRAVGHGPSSPPAAAATRSGSRTFSSYRARPTTMPWSHLPPARRSRCTSSTDVMPPAHRKGTSQAAHRRAVSSAAPAMVPSRLVSVTRRQATPASCRRRANWAGSSSVVSCQPWLAGLPSFKSTAAITRPG